MNKLLHKIKTWFKPKTKPVAKPKPSQLTYQPINYKYYRKLIGKLAKRAIAIQRVRQKERRAVC